MATSKKGKGALALKFDPDAPIPGYLERMTPFTKVKVIEIDFIADPEKRSEEWERDMRARMLDDRKWRREFKRDWTITSGDAFYPEFDLLGGRKMYCFVVRGILNTEPIIRGWDFGFNHPACIWFQRSRKSGRVYVIREFSPEGVGTHTFVDVVKYLSGQLELSDLDGQELKWVQRIKEDPTLPDPPWFPRTATPLEWWDFAGPEVLKNAAQVEDDKKGRSDYEILHNKGIPVQWNSVSPKFRENVLRKLLKLRRDGRPGILIDPSCFTFLKGLGGGIAYPEPTKEHPSPDEPAKDKYYEHLHDAIGYALTQVVPVTEVEDKPQAPERYIYRGRVPIPLAEIEEEERETMGYYETSGRLNDDDDANSV